MHLLKDEIPDILLVLNVKMVTFQNDTLKAQYAVNVKGWII